jgi:hypothetical protein
VRLLCLDRAAWRRPNAHAEHAHVLPSLLLRLLPACCMVATNENFADPTDLYNLQSTLPLTNLAD